MKKLLIFSVIALSFAFAFSASAANLLTNGGFETPVVGNGGWGVFPAGTSGLGWTPMIYDTVTYNWPVPVIEIQGNYFGQSAEGNQYAELDSYGSTLITEDVSTIVGCEYRLSYYWSPRPGVNDNNLVVYLNGVEVPSLALTDRSGSFAWTAVTHDFTADLGTTNVGFSETLPSDQLGMFLDGVSLELTSTPSTYYQDADGDGYGNSAISQEACSAPARYVTDNTDCDDAVSTTYPSASELCDGVDNDCDAATFDGFKESWYNEATNCGIGGCARDGQWICQAGQKTDTCVASEPALIEVCDYGTTHIDDDCDGYTDEDACAVKCDSTSDVGLVGTVAIGTNRWVYYSSINPDFFSTTQPKGKGWLKGYSLDLTNDCSCNEILTWLHEYDPILYGNMEGHLKYGCSISVMDEFIRLTRRPAPYTIGDVWFHSPYGDVKLDFNAHETSPATGEVNWLRFTGSTNWWNGPVIWTDVLDANTALFTVLVQNGTPPAVLGCDITFKVIDDSPDSVQITAVVDDPLDSGTCGAVGQVQGPWNIYFGNLVVVD